MFLIPSHEGDLIRGPFPPHIPHPASVWVEWDSVDAAVYEVQWFGDVPLTLMVGSATVTNSEMDRLASNTASSGRIAGGRRSLRGGWSAPERSDPGPIPRPTWGIFRITWRQ